MSSVKGRVGLRLQAGGVQNVTPRFQPIRLGIGFTRERTKIHAPATHIAGGIEATSVPAARDRPAIGGRCSKIVADGYFSVVSAPYSHLKTFFLIVPCTPQLASTTCVTPKSV